MVISSSSASYHSSIFSLTQNNPPFTCSTAASSTSSTTDLVPSKLQHLVAEFHSLPEPVDRLKRLLHYASAFLPPFPNSSRVDSNQVMGCTARV
ncbi:hypothetical protein Tsubulata_050847 [Turnera subulata]|uniref:Fe-S metabolism associated domain-containing protein n=1 Tax=Turnera subulata TaxID=218843 RepID=A0A9Q0G7F4_9ROSI|nr:hypothetical protein Tsubulata_050847 [Turnera subulata]